MGTPARNKCILVACTMLAFATLAPADTLYLKNGMYLIVTKANEKDGQIEYWIGSTKYTIAKELVAKIEPGNGPSTNTHSATSMNHAAPAVQDLSHRESDPEPIKRGPRQTAVTRSGPSQSKTSLTGQPYVIAFCRGIASTR